MSSMLPPLRAQLRITNHKLEIENWKLAIENWPLTMFLGLPDDLRREVLKFLATDDFQALRSVPSRAWAAALNGAEVPRMRALKRTYEDFQRTGVVVVRGSSGSYRAEGCDVFYRTSPRTWAVAFAAAAKRRLVLLKRGAAVVLAGGTSRRCSALVWHRRDQRGDVEGDVQPPAKRQHL